MILRETISRKQVGVIYKAIKNGKIEADQSDITYTYNMTEKRFGDIDYSGRTTQAIAFLKKTVDAIFEDDFEKAQRAFNIACNK